MNTANFLRKRVIEIIIINGDSICKRTMEIEPMMRRKDRMYAVVFLVLVINELLLLLLRVTPERVCGARLT